MLQLNFKESMYKYNIYHQSQQEYTNLITHQKRKRKRKKKSTLQYHRLLSDERNVENDFFQMHHA